MSAEGPNLCYIIALPVSSNSSVSLLPVKLSRTEVSILYDVTTGPDSSRLLMGGGDGRS